MVQKYSKAGFLLKLATAAVLAALLCFCLVLNFAFPTKYSDIVAKEAKNFGIKPQLIYAVIWTESKFKKDAVSSAGAVGLMQLLPSTAAFCAKSLNEPYSDERLTDPMFNIRMGVFYLRYLIDKLEAFGIDAAIAAYNAGEGNLFSWIGGSGVFNPNCIQFKETRDYLRRINLATWVYGVKV